MCLCTVIYANKHTNFPFYKNEILCSFFHQPHLFNLVSLSLLSLFSLHFPSFASHSLSISIAATHTLEYIRIDNDDDDYGDRGKNGRSPFHIPIGVVFHCIYNYLLYRSCIVIFWCCCCCCCYSDN